MIIIRDKQEKVGYWDFSHYPDCEGQVVEQLKTADYTIKGYENIVVVERKRTVAEIAVNLGSAYDRFRREFERMTAFKYACVLCEFTLSDTLSFPANVPHKLKKVKMKMNGKFILKRINELENEFGIDFIFCGSKTRAEEIAMDLFRKVIKEHV